jgi:DNA invertase Pin-like site-specific DNA recombinase
MDRNNTIDKPPVQGTFLTAAEYVRMSTDHQQYSTQNQTDKIREYADQHGIEIVRTYADEGRSGLNIDGRDALQRLISDVQSGDTNFQIILVYDVSRWGCFQDPDEAAYYEHICRRKGIMVEYVAEPFDNDGSGVSTIVKGVKRVMAGEYSRELSTKVFAGQCRLIELGYRQGGPAGYGLRRKLIDQSGAPKADLVRGEHKSLQTDRVILVPGPEDEQRIVNLVYQWFINESLSESAIAGRLNGMKVRTDLDRPWTRSTVQEVLTNEKYIGNNIYNRTSFKLKKERTVNPPELWIRKDGAFDPIVPPEMFYTVQGIMRERARRYTDEELIERLRDLYQKHGYLSGLIINETESMPSAAVYAHRFDSLIRAYKMVGYWSNSRRSSLPSLSINSNLFLPADFLEISARIATHPAATRAWGVDHLTKQFDVVPDISPPMESASGFQSRSMVPTQCAFHVFHRISPGSGRHPVWARPVV